ncbi:MAG: DUF5916 domain-containing protein [bacterium]
MKITINQSRIILAFMLLNFSLITNSETVGAMIQTQKLGNDIISTEESNTGNKAIMIINTNEDITIDGILDEEIWQEQPISSFIQRDPNEGLPSTEKTNVWIAYDNNYIYVAGMMYDSKPDSINRILLRRDDWQPSDWIEIYFDTFKDSKTAYYFGINAAGSKEDGTFYNDSWDDPSWDGIWEAKSQICSDGWRFEMRIPFSQLRFANSESMTWGVNLKRTINRLNELSYYAMVPKTESGFVSRFAELKGINGIEPKQRIEALPHIAQKAQYLIHDENDPFYKSNQYQTSFGGDLKIGLGSNLNLDVTVNPDFGQVEVDPAIVNLTAFETIYQEKRPFFIEGANTFGFGRGGATSNWNIAFSPPQLFYSRRIGRSPQGWSQHDGYTDQPGETRILGAAKLTGKIGDANIGFISALTDKMFAQTDSSGTRFKDEIEPLTHYGVLRAQQQFNDGRQALGMIFTSVNRDLPDNYLKDRLSNQAYTFGIDGWTFLDEDQTYVITGAAVGSYTSGTKKYMQRLQRMPHRYFQSPDASSEYSFNENLESMSGWYSRISLNKQKGNVFINSAFAVCSPTFESNDLGVQRDGNKIYSHLVLGYRWYEPDGLFRRKSIYAAYNRHYDFEGNLLQNGFYMTGILQFNDYSTITFEADRMFDYNSREFTRGGPIVKLPGDVYGSISYVSDNRNVVSYSATGYIYKETKDLYNYELSASIDWKPSPSLLISIGPAYNYLNAGHEWVTAKGDVLAEDTYGKRYIYANMIQKTISAELRINWTFTPELSLQAYLQPYFSVGTYNDFNQLLKSRTYDFMYYGKDNNSRIVYDTDNSIYTVDPDGDGSSQEFSFGNPDFNFKSFRANLVLRWEVQAGSVLYLVWTRDQIDEDYPGDLRFGRDFKNLFSRQANNVFMAKFSYWLDI